MVPSSLIGANESLLGRTVRHSPRHCEQSEAIACLTSGGFAGWEIASSLRTSQ